jgi:type IV pilus assembly protein PilY1
MPASAGLNIGSTPLYLGASVQPIVMLNLPRDHQLFVKAYNDYSDLDGDGVVENQYKHSVAYYGYFDAFKCYSYDTATHRFNPINPQRVATATDKYCSDAGVQATSYSGNFLNWSTMARIDVIRKILYGGTRVVDSGTSAADTLTVLERTVVPTDVHAWAKYYDGGASNDIARLTPFAVSNAQNSYATTAVANKTVRVVTSMTVPGTSTAVTVNSATHGYVVGDVVQITGSDQPKLNGTFTVAAPVVVATSFTVTLPAAIGAGLTTSNNAGISVTKRATTMSVTNSGQLRNILVGDQVRATATTNAAITLTGVVTAATGASVTFNVDGSTGGCTGTTGGCAGGAGAAGDIDSWTVTNLSSNGITICNVTQATTGNTETINTATSPPLMRVARGNFALWNVGDGRSCRWSVESNPINGNQAFFSEINANANTPVQATVALGTGTAAGDFAVRVKVCDPAVLGQEKCAQYPNGNWKPVGLLQDYSSSNNRKIKFGLFTGSFSRNKSGGVLRKNAAFLDTAVAPAAAAATDELDVNTGILRNVDGIIKTLDRLRIFGYDYAAAAGNYSSNSDGCGSAGLLNPADGTCSSWGNPISEIYGETLRYLAGKAVDTAFTPTPPAAGTYSSGGLTKDNILGLRVHGWQDPLSTANYCAPLNVLVFNASVNSYDNDQIESSLNTAFAISTKAKTKDVGIAEGITSGSSWMIGDKGNSVAATAGPGGICTPKAFDQANVLGDVLGVCPEAPALFGTYLLAGAAHWAHTNRIRADLTLPATDRRSLKVNTYGISLTTATPKILIPVPGTGALASPAGSVPARFVTILPTGKSLSPSYVGGGSIADFRIVRQDVVNGTGKFAVQWEDSLQGNDYDLDTWGVISYRFLSGNTQIEVTTQVIYGSAGFSLGFGFVISGTTPANTEGEHFLSAFKGTNNTVFNYTAADGTAECADCKITDGARSRIFNVSGSASATVLQEPLWYASKYGGFIDVNNNGLPDQIGEWDSRKQDGSDGTDGVPDTFFQVTNPGALEQAMDRAFIYILQVSSASSVATNSTSLTTGSRVYQARFNSNEWSGQLLSFTIDVNGVIDPVPNFDAGQKMPSFGARTIVTYHPGATAGTAAAPFGVPFRWNNLTAAQQTELRKDGGSGTADAAGTLCTADNVPAGCTDRGSIRLNYLRGDQTNEGATATRFRVRPSTVLADIVNSTPRFVGPPNASFSDATYLAFRSTYANRTPMLYVGSNGGMMHAFEATTGSSGGVERLAYVPQKMYSNLTKLTHKSYSHRYYIDGTPSVNDACFGSCTAQTDWKTVAVGGYNAGGQGYYALDVTDPSTWNEGNAGNIVLWEFTDVNDPDLGFSYSKPLIVKMSNGRWAAIFGNGYNSSTQDPGETACVGGSGTSAAPYTPAGCSVGLTGHASLYIVFLDGATDGVWTQGSDYIKISTNTGTDTTTPSAFTPAAPNGLATPVAVDSNGDGQIDFVYAGDLVGNLWKFDLSSASATNWRVASAGAPLFVAQDASSNRQAITSAPVLFTHPSGGFVVQVGTGKYLEVTDDSGPYTVNSMYGIWDRLDDSIVTRSELMQQKVLNVSAANKTGGLVVGSNTVRLTSAYVPNYSATARTNAAGTFGDADTNPNSVALTNTTPANQRGWLIDFPNSGDNSPPSLVTPGTGERVVFDPLITTSKLVFTTLIPSTIPCEAGGTSFVMDMDPVSGSRLSFSPFDINGDSTFSNADFVTYGGVQIAVTGLGSTIGIVPQPTVIAAQPGKEVKVLSGSTGGLMAVLENAPTSTPTGGRVGRRITWRELLSD